jgi:hypothetical protein
MGLLINGKLSSFLIFRLELCFCSVLKVVIIDNLGYTAVKIQFLSLSLSLYITTSSVRFLRLTGYKFRSLNGQ